MCARICITESTAASKAREQGDSKTQETPASAQSTQADKEKAAEERRRAAEAFIGGNRNKNTALTYAGGWKRFQAYLDRIGVAGEGVTEVEVAAFLQERYQKDGVKSSTLQADKAAIADGLKAFKNGAAAGRLVAEMMAVLASKAEPPTPKRHMSLELMRSILQTFKKEGELDAAGANTPAIKRALLARRNNCLFLFMLLGMLRASEAVGLVDGDVVLGEEQSITTLSLFIRRSKGDQEQKGEEVRLGENKTDSLACPVAAYKQYRELKEVQGQMATDTAFFGQRDGQALAAATPNFLVQTAVNDANLRWRKDTGEAQHFGAPEEYGSHSMRRGGVTLARDSGVSMLDIQRHGRWKSLLVFNYVGRTLEQQLAVTATLMRSEKQGAVLLQDSDCVLVEMRGNGDKLGKAAVAAAGGSGVKDGQSKSRKRSRSQEKDDDAEDLDEDIFVPKYISGSASKPSEKKKRGPRGSYKPRQTKAPESAPRPAKKPRLEVVQAPRSAPAKHETAETVPRPTTTRAQRKLDMPKAAEVLSTSTLTQRE